MCFYVLFNADMDVLFSVGICLYPVFVGTVGVSFVARVHLLTVIRTRLSLFMHLRRIYIIHIMQCMACTEQT